MFNIFTLLPLLFFLMTSYFFNHRKLMGKNRKIIILISLLEGIFSFLVTFIFFLHGFIPIFPYLIIIFILSLTLGFISFSIEKDLNDELDLQFETIKNNLVLFMLTLLPLYVFLTIFRFLDLYLQISFAILLSGIILGLSFLIQKLFGPIFSKLIQNISESGPGKYMVLGLSSFLIVVMIFLFNLPTIKVSQQLNLSNNIGFLSFDGFPKTLNNHYHANNLIQIESSNLIDSDITDYYYNQTHLYVYTSQGTLIIYDLSTKEIASQVDLGKPTTTEGLNDNKIYNKFTLFDEQLILSGVNGTYLVTPDLTIKISDFTYYNSSKFYHDEQLYYLYKINASVYEIYQFSDRELILTETIDLASTSFNSVLVISDHLFYIDNDQYILYNNHSIAFNILNGYPIYDENRQIMYYTKSNKIINNTNYQKVYVTGETSSIKLSKVHNQLGIIIDDMIYYTEGLDDKMDRIEIMNSQFKFDSIFNHHALQPFWVGNQSHSYIANYQENDNHLEFLQVDQNRNHVVLTIKKLEDRNVSLNLPFYTHYGLGIFIPIIIALFIPITNYRKTTTIISFDSAINKKR